MTTTFQLAEPRRNYEWDKSLAFALAPAVAAGMSIHFFLGKNTMAIVVALVVFFGIVACSLAIMRPNFGYIELGERTLRVIAGRFRMSIALEHLDVAAAALSPDAPAGDSTAFVTNPAKAIAIPMRGDQVFTISPDKPEAFLRVLRQAASEAR